MTSNIIKYSLAPKGKPNEPLCYSIESNDNAPFAISVAHDFEPYINDGQVWLVDTVEEAEKARDARPEWFNSGYSTPSHDAIKNIGELEVIKVEFNITQIE